MHTQEIQQFRVLTEHVICGVTVQDGKIVAAGSFVEQFIGKPLEELQRWIKSEGGKVEPLV